MDKIKLRHICVFSIQKLIDSRENLVFLGMMGSGKSSIGYLVSKNLKIDFIDVDNEIEKKTGLKVSKIFEQEREKYFRQIEEVETIKFLKNKKTVISLGGGAFLNNRIKKEVLNNWFGSLFPWLERCEKFFGFKNLKGYDTTRLYAFLAERYLSYWFKKYTNHKEQPWVFIDE